MNKRMLEKFAVQSLVEYDGELIFSKEKFAESIVKECGRYLDSPEFIGRGDLDWSIVLNEYFGVE